jgi:adenine phosphoribosyltransferase
MSLIYFKKSLIESSIIKKGSYNYLVHPITDGIPKIDSILLEEIVNEMRFRIKKIGDFDKLVTIEAMGLPIASILSYVMKIPLVIIRKRSYKIPGEIEIEQKTGYSKSKLYINGFKTGDRIVIIDDIVSKGGTLSQILSALNKIGVEVKAIFIAIDKGHASKEIEKKFNIKIYPLVNIEIVNDKIVINNI